MRRLPAILTILTILTVSPVFAQDATPPAGRRQGGIEERRTEIQARRTEKQKQIVDRMKQKLAAVIDRLNNVAARLRNHVQRIRSRAQGNENVESSLTEAEKHIDLAETEINNVKAKLGELDETDKPRDAAQTFRTGVQSVHAHFKEARTNLVAALKVVREAAKAMPAGRQESRPTRPAETNQ